MKVDFYQIENYCIIFLYSFADYNYFTRKSAK